MRKDHNNDINLTGIKELIKKERQEGLEVFRKTDFSAKLEARIRSGEKSKYFWPYWLKKPVPVLGILLVMIVIAVIVKSFFIPSATRLEVVVIEKFLSQSPNMQRVFPIRQRQDMTISPGTKEFHRFEWSIQQILFSVKREGIKDEDVPSLVYRVLDKIGDPGKKEWMIHLDDESVRYFLDEFKNMKKTGRTSELFSLILKKLEEV